MSEWKICRRRAAAPGLRKRSLLTSVSAALALTVSMSASHAAEEYHVSDLQWKNNGAYLARVSVKWKSQATGNIGTTREGCQSNDGAMQADSYKVASGNVVVCHLHMLADKWYSLENDDEVWLQIDIAAGDNKSCRKDDVRLLF